MHALLLLIVAYARAEGTLEGTVVANNGLPIRRVVVTLRGPMLMSERVEATDHDGAFAFDGLPAGTYDVRFERHDFVALQYRGVEVMDGGRAVLDVNMTPDWVDYRVLARARWVGTAGIDAPAPAPHAFDGYAGWTIPLDPWPTTVAALASVAGPSQQVGARVAQAVPIRRAQLTVSVDALSQRGIPVDPWSPVLGPWAVLVGADVARR